MGAPIPTNMLRPPMDTDRDIMTLAQWLSPAFPIGAFAYSHGLEAAIGSGKISTGNDLKEWLVDILSHGSGSNDCILISSAYLAPDQDALLHVNQTALAFAASAERQLEQTLQGAAFAQTTSAVWGGTTDELVYPVAVGQAAARLRIDATLTAAMYLHAVVSNLISAAMRLMSLGQTEGQRILASLIPLCDTTAKAAKGMTLDDLQSTAFMADIAAMQHETLQPRIFRT